MLKDKNIEELLPDGILRRGTPMRPPPGCIKESRNK